VSSIEADVLVMHDRADSLVPSWESRLLAESLMEYDVEVRHTESSLFDHVDPTQDLGPIERVRELAKLYGHLYAIVRQAQ
jgi:hypothetical protein